MKRILISIVIVFFSIFLFPAFYSITQSQSLDIEKQEVIYELPYPGLLPDHPLYFIKSMRDKFLIFTTRDNQKKARLYLHLSDKHMSASLALVEKGKELLAVGELQKGEVNFLEIPPLLKEVKNQGGGFADQLVVELLQSNAKHRSVISQVMQNTTQTEIAPLESLLSENAQVMIELQGL